MEPMAGVKKHLFLMGRKWEVVFVKKGNILLSDKEAPVHGVCDSDTQSISICSREARDVQRQTLIHELRHAFDFMANGGHAEDEELCVRISENGWFQFWTDKRNRWAWDFIQEEVR